MMTQFFFNKSRDNRRVGNNKAQKSECNPSLFFLFLACTLLVSREYLILFLWSGFDWFGAEQTAVNVQTAMLTLEILARHYAHAYSDRFLAVVPAVLTAIQRPESEVKASALICLAALCRHLGPRILPHLPKLAPVVVQAVLQCSTDRAEELLFTSALAALDVICAELHAFLSPYLLTIVQATTHPYLLSLEAHTLSAHVDSVHKSLAEHVHARLLLPALTSAFAAATESSVRHWSGAEGLRGW